LHYIAKGNPLHLIGQEARVQIVIRSERLRCGSDARNASAKRLRAGDQHHREIRAALAQGFQRRMCRIVIPRLRMLDRRRTPIG